MPPNDQEHGPEPITEPNAAIVEGEKKPQNTNPTAFRNPDAFPEDLPPEVQHALTVMLGIMTRGSSSPTDPLLDKFNDEHINKYLDGLQKESQQEYELKKSNRWYYLLYVIAALVFLTIVIIFLAPTNPDLLKDVLQTLIVVITSFSGGFGFKVLLDRQNQ